MLPLQIASLPPLDLTLSEFTDLLPPVINNLLRVIGLDAMVLLVQTSGGTTISVPNRDTIRGDSAYDLIAARIGTEAADALVAHYSGEILYIPSCHFAVREFRYRTIRREFDVMTKDNRVSARNAVRYLAVKHTYSDRHIWSILKTADRNGLLENASAAPTAQLGLF